MKKSDYAKLYTLRPDGRYQGYWHELDANGEPRGPRHTICDRDPERLYERIAEKERPKAVTFRRAAEEWKVEHVESLERGSQSTYRAPIAKAIAELGDKPLEAITAGDINRIMLQERAGDFSYKHAALQRSVLKQIFDSAIVKGWIISNPVTAVGVPRGMNRGKIDPPTEDQTKVILANLDKPFGDFVALLFYTGLRTQEAAVLRWGDVTENSIKVSRAVDLHGTPKIKVTKTENAVRELRIVPQLRPYLMRPRSAKDSDLIFSDEGKLLTRAQITSRWLNWCKAAGLAEQRTYEKRHRGKDECTRTEWRPLVNPHQLRHSFASIAVNIAKVDELTLQSMLGHSDAEFTHKVYVSLMRQHEQEEAAKLDAAFDKM